MHTHTHTSLRLAMSQTINRMKYQQHNTWPNVIYWLNNTHTYKQYYTRICIFFTPPYTFTQPFSRVIKYTTYSSKKSLRAQRTANRANQETREMRHRVSRYLRPARAFSIRWICAKVCMSHTHTHILTPTPCMHLYHPGGLKIVFLAHADRL